MASPSSAWNRRSPRRSPRAIWRSLSARVIKIERPGGGDFARAYDHTVHGLCSHFVWVNRSKESLTLDLKQPAAAAVMARLLAHADVFVQNLAPGAT